MRKRFNPDNHGQPLKPQRDLVPSGKLHGNLQPKLQRNFQSKLYNNFQSKLTWPFILFFTFFTGILLALPCEAEYRIYLKNGQVISGVDNVKQETGKVKINRDGITLELSETGVIKIEEYNQFETTEKEAVEKEKSPAKKEMPWYSGYDEKSFYKRQRTEKIERARELNQAKKQYQFILNQLKKIEALEKRSKELKKRTRQKWSPRRARIARKEKEEVDRQLEGLGEKDSLLRQKEKLEDLIDRLERQ